MSRDRTDERRARTDRGETGRCDAATYCALQRAGTTSAPHSDWPGCHRRRLPVVHVEPV